MAAASDAPPTDINRMTRVQKLAILLIILGPESAATVIKSLDEHEVEVVTAEMARFSMISEEIQTGVLREFSEVAVEASTALRGGPDYAQQVLERAVGLFKATDIISRVAPVRTPVAAMQEIVDLDPRQIFNVIKNEQPQTIALVLSYLSAEKSAEVLALIRPELREQVIERLATLSPTPIEVVEKVVEVLNHKFGSKHTRALNQTGGVKATASVLNAMDKNLSKGLLVALEERNPELAQSIRQKMFTFEDLANLDTSALQKILREVDMRDLAVALKTASEKLKTALLSSISRRAAESVNEEISFMGPLKLRDIEAAQNSIIEAVRKLESDGEIELADPRENRRYETVA